MTASPVKKGSSGNATTTPAAATKPAATHPIWLIGAVATMYMTFSIVVVVLNKKCFAMGEHYPYPLTTTWFQMLIGLVCSVIIDIVQRLTGWRFVPLLNFKLSELIAVIPVSVVFIAMIATGNMCLSYLQISFFQTAKSLHIIFSLLLSFFLFGESQSRIVTTWAVLVTVGWVISTSGEPSTVFSLSGLLWGIASSFMVALYPIVLSRVMIKGLDRWQLGANNALLSVILLVPVVYVSNEWPHVAWTDVYTEGWFWNLMGVTAVAGFLLNFAAMANVHYSSPLSHMIAGSMKGVVQSALAWAFFGNHITLIGGLGSLLCVVAIAGYTYARQQEAKNKKK